MNDAKYIGLDVYQETTPSRLKGIGRSPVAQ
jgi:hypothetical protein